jgi:hypothetical protein
MACLVTAEAFEGVVLGAGGILLLFRMLEYVVVSKVLVLIRYGTTLFRTLLTSSTLR